MFLDQTSRTQTLLSHSHTNACVSFLTLLVLLLQSPRSEQLILTVHTNVFDDTDEPAMILP